MTRVDKSVGTLKCKFNLLRVILFLNLKLTMVKNTISLNVERHTNFMI